MSNSFIWPISGAATPGQCKPGSDGNEEVLNIPQSSSITGSSPSDCLVSYPGHSLQGVLPLCRDAVGVFCNPSQLDQINRSVYKKKPNWLYRFQNWQVVALWHINSCGLLLWPRKGSLMKTQTRILDNRLYYTRKIELHRKGKKSRTVRILICLW